MTWVKWVNDEGTVIDLRMLCPRTVDKLVEIAIETALHKQVAGASGKSEHEQGIYLDPIVRVIDPATRNKDPRWTPQAAAHLRYTVVGAQWPQARKHRAGLVEDPRCGAANGSLTHRHCGCRITAEARIQHLGIELADECDQVDGESWWWERALIPHSKVGLADRPTGIKAAAEWYGGP